MTMYKLTCAIIINTISPPTIKHWLHCIQPIYEIILFKRGVYSYSCELISFCLSYSYVYQPPPQLNAIIWTLLSFQRNLKTLSYKIKKKKKKRNLKTQIPYGHSTTKCYQLCMQYRVVLLCWFCLCSADILMHTSWCRRMQVC